MAGTTLNVVAHPDDDLLFLNPDIIDDLHSGLTPHIIYVTAGDERKGQLFIRQRQEALSNAYALTRAALHYFPFRSNHFQSGDVYGDIYKLWHFGKDVSSLDSKAWEREDVLIWLRYFIYQLKPTLIRTHEPTREPALDKDGPELDHVDHIYVGKFVVEAAKNFPETSVFTYEGYPIRTLAPNVDDKRAQKKLSMWRKYQEIDTTVAGEQWDIAMNRCHKRQVQ